MLNSIRKKLLSWLDVDNEMGKAVMTNEAWFDIHILNLPVTPEIYDNAIMNCMEFNSKLLSGEATIQDRLTSLIEVLKRSKLIQEAQ